MVARQRIWTIWGLASLVWLVVGTALFGAGLGGPANGVNSTRPAPLLSRPDCSRIADDQGAQTCLGVTAIARQRRIMQYEAQARGSVIAGSIIVGPPIAGMLAVWGFGRAAERRRPVRPMPLRTSR